MIGGLMENETEYIDLVNVLMGSDQDGKIYILQAIKREDGLWLIPSWLENPSEGWKIPERIIRVDPSEYEELGGDYPAEYHTKHPVPRAVLNGQSRTVEGISYDVVERPDIRIQIPPGIH